VIEELSYKEERDAHISYLDENNNVVDGWFKIITLTDGWLSFKTTSNTITIPISRLIKIKERDSKK